MITTKQNQIQLHLIQKNHIIIHLIILNVRKKMAEIYPKNEKMRKTGKKNVHSDENCIIKEKKSKIE